MKTSFALAVGGALLLGSGTAFAQGSAVIIKQRAKEIRNQNNVEQGVPSPAPAVPSAAPGAASAPAAPARPLTPQQQILVRLRADLIAIKPEAPANLAMKQQLARDLMAAAQGPNKPSQLAANKLAESLSSALSEKLLSATTRQRLFQDVNAVLNPQKIPPPQLADITGDIQAIFQANNLDRKEAAAIAGDAKALALEIQKADAK
ncbi:MAG TPA: hypothetical protein VN829_24360 [Dongiaceae bacterium]|nr:hypothetical protein [Dongiaceae bacterium]